MLSMIRRDIADLRLAQLPTVRPAAERFGKFLGKYRITSGDDVVVSVEGESLVAQRASKPEMVLLNAAPNKFELGRTELTFLSDSTGSVTHVHFHGDGISVLARKVD